jgi:D-alanyl-D-alanine carboxypeptidase
MNETSDRGAIDRRTLLMSAAGALAAAAMSAPTGASAFTPSGLRSVAKGFDADLARKLQAVLHAVLRDPGVRAPGVILHVRSPALGRWTGTAGLGRLDPKTPMLAGDRFRAGSVVKPFVAAVILQLVERGRLSLDARLPDVLPAEVTDRFASAPQTTIRMLLGHRSGIPEWDLPEQDEYAARHPAHAWTTAEILDLASAKPQLFAPGTAYAYSNTEYNLLGLIIEQATGWSWRYEVAHRVVRPLGLTHTSLPRPGNLSIRGPHAHGYLQLDGRLVDRTRLDPSMAGAAGGSALITTVGDLARFWDSLLAGRLFRHRATLDAMLTFAATPGEITSGYGLGVEQYILPDDVELIGHLGGAGTYRTFVGRQNPHGATLSFAMNHQDDPSPLILPVIETLESANHSEAV